jgi:16S rRNA (adenine1518-N6/adenine1519-N6)-dimethyltransferase
MTTHLLIERHQPRKRFGQNFLQDQSVIDHIVRVIAPLPTDALVEIGPGQGAMTMPLLRATGSMRAIELDRDLIEPLRHMAAGFGQLDVISADALTVDFSQLANASQKLRVVGNLPYNISTPLIFHLLTHVDAIVDMHFMLQKEVVDRIASGPGSKVYGRLSVMVQARAQAELMFLVPPKSFFPVPKVDSAIVRLVPLAEQPSEGLLAALDHLTRLAFGARRKTLSNSLGAALSPAHITACDIDPRRRAETLSQQEFQHLAKYFLQLGNTPPSHLAKTLVDIKDT